MRFALESGILLLQVGLLTTGCVIPRYYDAKRFYEANQVVIQGDLQGELHDEAMAKYNEAIAIFPRHHGAYYRRAELHAKLGQHDQAFADYTKAAEFGAQNVKKWGLPYLGRGRLYAKLGKYEQAISDFTKALEADPEWGLPYLERARTYWYLGQHDRALIDYSKGTTDLRTRMYEDWLKKEGIDAGFLKALREASVAKKHEKK